MKAINLIYNTCMFLGKIDLCTVLKEYFEATKNNGSYTFFDKHKNELSDFVPIINEMTEDIATKYFEFLTDEELVCDSDGLIKFEQFSKSPNFIKRVENENGMLEKFMVLPYSIKVNGANKTKKVYYSFIPDKIETVYDEVMVPPIFTENALTYLLCYHFLLHKNLYDEAKVFENKFLSLQFGKRSYTKNRRLRKYSLL